MLPSLARRVHMSKLRTACRLTCRSLSRLQGLQAASLQQNMHTCRAGLQQDWPFSRVACLARGTALSSFCHLLCPSIRLTSLLADQALLMTQMTLVYGLQLRHNVLDNIDDKTANRLCKQCANCRCFQIWACRFCLFFANSVRTLLYTSVHCVVHCLF